jgi:hypothetical protein
MSDEHESVLVKLTRMEGKLDLSNLRHDQHDQRFAALDTRLNSHGERISGMERREAERGGERKGLTTAGRVAWAGIGLIPGGAIVAALMRLFGS